MTTLALTFGIAGLFLALAKWIQQDDSIEEIWGKLASGVFVWAAILSITLMVGLRGYSVGIDTIAYVRNIQDVAAGTFSAYDWQSPLYYLIVLTVVHLFGGSYTVLFLICGFLVGYLFCMGLWKSCPQPWLGLLIIFAFGYFIESENQVRELIAVGVVFYSYSYLAGGEKGKFAVGCLVAIGFHASAIVSFLLLLPSKHEVSIRTILVLLLIAVAFTIMMFMYPGLLASIPIYGGYFSSAYNQASTILTVGNCIVRCAAMLLLVSVQKHVISEFPDYPLLIKAICIGALFQILTIQNVVFGRIPIYFMVFFALALPEALVCLRKSESRIVAKGIAAVFICGFLLANLSFKDYSKFEYVFFWDEPTQIILNQKSGF